MDLMSTAQLLGNLGEFVGAIAVVATLIYLALQVRQSKVQINQNSDLVREQLAQSRWTDDLNLHLAMMGDNPARALAVAIENPSALSVEETRVLDAYFSYWTLAETRKIRMHERGMTVDPPFEYAPGSRGFPMYRRILGNAYYKAKFEEHGAGPALTQKLQALMDSFSGQEAWEEYTRVQERIKKT